MKTGPPRGARKEKLGTKRARLPRSPVSVPSVVRQERPEPELTFPECHQLTPAGPAPVSHNVRQEQVELVPVDHSQPAPPNSLPTSCEVPQAQFQDAKTEAGQANVAPGLASFEAIAPKGTSVISAAGRRGQEYSNPQIPTPSRVVSAIHTVQTDT